MPRKLQHVLSILQKFRFHVNFSASSYQIRGVAAYTSPYQWEESASIGDVSWEKRHGGPWPCEEDDIDIGYCIWVKSTREQIRLERQTA